MGEQAIAYFAEAERLGGIVCRMRLASMSQLTSIEAAAVPDSPEIIERIEHAMTKLRVDFSRPTSTPSPPPPPPASSLLSSSSGASGAGTSSSPGAGFDREVRFDTVPDAPRASTSREVLKPASGLHTLSPSGTYGAAVPAAPADPRTLRRQLGAIVDLMSQRSVLYGNVAEAARRVDEIASSIFEAARVGTWFLDDARTRLHAVDVFDRRTLKHGSAMEFSLREHPSFLRALERERTIAAHQAAADGRTSSLARPWLEPAGVTSMLVAPIWAEGRLAGLVSIEHSGLPHSWTPDEENVAFLLAGFIGITAEQASRPRHRP